MYLISFNNNRLSPQSDEKASPLLFLIKSVTSELGVYIRRNYILVQVFESLFPY